MGFESLATDLLGDIESPGLDGRFSISLIHAREFRETHDQLGFFLNPHIATLRPLLLSE